MWRFSRRLTRFRVTHNPRHTNRLSTGRQMSNHATHFVLTTLPGCRIRASCTSCWPPSTTAYCMPREYCSALTSSDEQCWISRIRGDADNGIRASRRVSTLTHVRSLYHTFLNCWFIYWGIYLGSGKLRKLRITWWVNLKKMELNLPFQMRARRWLVRGAPSVEMENAFVRPRVHNRGLIQWFVVRMVNGEWGTVDRSTV